MADTFVRIVLIISDSLLLGTGLAPHRRLLRKGNERKGGCLPTLTDFSESPLTKDLQIWQISWSGLAAAFGTNSYPAEEFAYKIVEDYEMMRTPSGKILKPDLIVFWIGMNDCRAVHMRNRLLAEENAIQEFAQVARYGDQVNERLSQKWMCDLIGTGEVIKRISQWIEQVRLKFADLSGYHGRATEETKNIKALWVGPGTALKPTEQQRRDSKYIQAAEARKEARHREVDRKYPGAYMYVRHPRTVGKGDPKKRLCPYNKLVSAINRQAQRHSKRHGNRRFLHEDRPKVFYRKIGYVLRSGIRDEFNHLNEQARPAIARQLLGLIRQTLGMV